MKKNKGFTLIELMVAIAVFAVVTALAVPSMKNFSDNNRRVADVNNLVGALNLARSEAVKRSTPVTICHITTAATGACDTTGANDGIWSQGWIVFVDPDGDGVVDGGETIIRRNDPLQGSSNNTVSMIELNSSLNFITFNANGFSSSSATFARCGQRDTAALTQQFAKAVLISSTGNVRLGEDTNSDNIVNGVSGSNITCP